MIRGFLLIFLLGDAARGRAVLKKWKDEDGKDLGGLFFGTGLAFHAFVLFQAGRFATGLGLWHS